MLTAQYAPYRLMLKFDARTSRGSMTHKDTWLVKVFDDSEPEVAGLGECAVFHGLSADDVPDYEHRLALACQDVLRLSQDPSAVGMSSITFGLECSLQDLRNGGHGLLYPSGWTRGQTTLDINGLVWMADHDTMLRRIEQKLAQGHRCIKLKVGAIDPAEELDLIRHIRQQFPDASHLELRLDANGAFGTDARTVVQRLESLAKYDIHSIEQPVPPGHHDVMSEVCRHSPIPVALDEELIGCWTYEQQEQLLETIQPQYVILKPSLCGGLQAATRWVSAARHMDIGWWATSAMESNIGLDAIAQWVATYSPSMPQGLGTGELYINNFTSPTHMRGPQLAFDPAVTRTLSPQQVSWQ